jgi:hypothetical protein
MKTHKVSIGCFFIISTALVVFTFLSAGCTSEAPPKPAELPTDSVAGPVSKNVPSPTEMISGTAEVSGQVTPNKVNVTKRPACPKLDSQLNQVVASSDPTGMAASLGLRLNEGKVQVRLVLASNDASFLKEFGVEPGSQAGQEIQAFVPLDQLCEIANHEQVLAIRIPAQGIIP